MNYETDEMNKENMNQFCQLIDDQKSENARQKTKYQQTWCNSCGLKYELREVKDESF